MLTTLGRWLTLLLFVAITILALLPQEPALVEGWNDKFKHVLAFVSLAVCLSCFWPLSRAAVFCMLLCYAVLIEVLQSLIPGRFADIADVMADVAGILFGLVLFRLLSTRIKGTDE